VVLLLGSNVEQEDNIQKAQLFLRSLFPSPVFTGAIWTNPVGVDTDRYLNCMCVFYTSHGIAQVVRALKHLENKIGSTTAERNRDQIKIDLDIMMFGNEKMHLNDWNREYVIRLYKELREKEGTSLM